MFIVLSLLGYIWPEAAPLFLDWDVYELSDPYAQLCLQPAFDFMDEISVAATNRCDDFFCFRACWLHCMFIIAGVGTLLATLRYYLCQLDGERTGWLLQLSYSVGFFVCVFCSLSRQLPSSITYNYLSQDKETVDN
jgi:hypothetical protein